MSTTGFAAGYLTSPDLFPSRASGEPWGEDALSLHFAGAVYRIDGATPAQSADLSQRFGATIDVQWKENEGGSDLTLYRVDRQEFRRIDRSGWRSSLDFDHGDERVRVAGLDLMGLLLRQRGGIWRAAMFTGEPSGSRFTDAFENLFRVLVAYRLLDQDGLLLHSAGAVLGERGARLFIGPSGAGKTTIARLCLEAGGRVLSDDLNAVTAIGSVPMVERVPFAGDLRAASRCKSQAAERQELQALYRLRQGTGACFQPLSPASAVATIMASCPFVNTDRHRLEQLSVSVERLVNRVPVGTLTFARDRGFIAVLEQTSLAERGRHRDTLGA